MKVNAKDGAVQNPNGGRDGADASDIDSLRRELAERRRLDALKDQLVAAVSHEIRNPLMIIQAAVGGLREGWAGELTEKQASLAYMADRSSRRLLRIADNLLELSRFEAGRMTV